MIKFRPVGPKGEVIVGTLEQVQGVALVNFMCGGEIEYAGETHVDWESQQPVDDERGRIWVDESGNRHSESDLKWEEIK